MSRERDWLPKGSKHHNAKLTEDDVKLILELNKERLEIRRKLQGVTIGAIAEKFGVSPSVINHIVLGDAWTHV